MKIKLSFKFWKGAFIALWFFCFILSTQVSAEEMQTNNNRYNVMLVADASGSMQYTDSEGYRYDALDQFIHFLPQEGDVVGCLVFSTDIMAESVPTRIENAQMKEDIYQTLKNVAADGEWTNIGLALETAVERMKEYGDPNLPSVIVLLSDGNTDMPTEEALEESLQRKADAIYEASQNDIQIYSVCLNVPNSEFEADPTEMQQISDGTKGAFEEISQASDLKKIFNTFYDIIYGASTIELVDTVFPSNGKIRTQFEIPGFGVEEINIVINGKTINVVLFDPDGNETYITPYQTENFTIVKIQKENVIPGIWRLVTEGVGGDKIKINMVYNSNLRVKAQLLSEGVIPVGEPVTITAVLSQNGTTATDASQYNGYKATLKIMDGYQKEIQEMPMSLNTVDAHLFFQDTLEEGTYYFFVHISGKYFKGDSEVMGPVEFTATPDSTQALNTPPLPVSETITEDIYLVPFRDVKYTLNLNTLATDAEDETLHYEIISTPFIEGKDYRIKMGEVLEQKNFSLKKGAYIIRATDSGGLFCDIELVIQTHNVGWITMRGVMIAAVIACILAFLLYDKIVPPFRGKIAVQSLYAGNWKNGGEQTPRRGKYRLSSFMIDNIGLNYNKSFFKATGKGFIWFLPNRPVMWNGELTDKIRVQSGIDTIVWAENDNTRQLTIRFESRIAPRNMPGKFLKPKPPKSFKPPKAPKRPKTTPSVRR